MLHEALGIRRDAPHLRGAQGPIMPTSFQGWNIRYPVSTR